MAIALESSFDELAELDREGLLVEEVVHAEARARGFAGVGRADAFFRGADATKDRGYGSELLEGSYGEECRRNVQHEEW